MEGIPRWEGLSREWQLALDGWRALPDNPLWILTGRMHAHSAPRQRRSRTAALVIWGCVLLFLYGSVFATLVIAGQGWPSPREFLQMLIMAVAAPLAVVFVLYATAQLALQGQAWLGRERGDARNVQAALLDPLLGLTALGPREVVLACLRSLGPLVAYAAGAGSLVATAVILAMAYDSGEFGLALLAAPVTALGYFTSGALGGLVLLLLSFCLGLNSTSAAPRTALVFLLLLHQLCGFGFSFAAFGVMDMADSHLLEALGGAFTAHAYIFAACWSGLWMLLHVRRAGVGWLLAMPVIWVVGFYLMLAAVALYSALTNANFDAFNGDEALGSLIMSLLGSWGAINLFSPAGLVTSYSFGEFPDNLAVELLLSLGFGLRVTLLAALVVVGYRAAVFCAALRLRAME